MIDQTPDKWVILKIGEINPMYKVFATWNGGYLEGDSWRINSGISEVEKNGDYINFYGYSGSCYKCHKKSYGISNYGKMVLDSILNNPNLSEENKIEVLKEGTNWEKLIK